MKTGVAFFTVVGVLGILWFTGTRFPDEVPDVRFKDTKGNSVSMKELRGKPVLLTFWSPTCSICLREIPDLVSLYEEFSPEGFRLFGVAMAYDPPNRVIETARKWNFPFPVVLDLKSELAKAFGSVEQIPANFLIAPDGSVALHRLGRIDLQNLRPMIRNMLIEEPR